MIPMNHEYFLGDTATASGSTGSDTSVKLSVPSTCLTYEDECIQPSSNLIVVSDTALIHVRPAFCNHITPLPPSIRQLSVASLFPRQPVLKRRLWVQRPGQGQRYLGSV